MTANLTAFEREIATPLEELDKPRPCMGCGQTFAGFNIHCADCSDRYLLRKAELAAHAPRDDLATYVDDRIKSGSASPLDTGHEHSAYGHTLRPGQ